MSDWIRVTRETPVESLPAELVAAIQQHIERHNLGSVLADILMCIQTDSEKVKKGLFGGAETLQMGAVVTPRWLVWAIAGKKMRPAALSAQLIHLMVQDYEQTPFAKMVPDSGIQVSGIFTGASESASAFLGLDHSPAGRKFRETVIRAAQEAKK